MADTETTLPGAETTTIIPVATPLLQAHGSQLFKLNIETTAAQVKMNDGMDVETRVNTLERALAANTTNHVVDDIAERDAMRNLIYGDTVHVLDASADDTVETGGATYLVLKDLTFRKLNEDESMDIVCNWEHVQDKPASPAEQIDMAVARQHRHGNMTVLDLLSDDSPEGQPGTGCLLYNGRRINDGLRDVAFMEVGGQIPKNLRDGGLIVINPAVISAE